MDPYIIAIALFGGLVAGGINTLAGNGSAITLLILTEFLGLPPNVANGSNRLGVFAGSSTASFLFWKKGKLQFTRSKKIIWPTILGAIAGVWTATQVSNEQFLWVFKIMLLIMLGVVLVNPKRWLSDTDKDFELPMPVIWIIFLAVGFYGGFIQMGMGIIFLAAMVLGARYSIIDANGVKVWIVALYTIICIAIFQWRGLISWPEGLLLAAGQAVGGYIAARFALQHPNAGVWAYRLLVVIILWGIWRVYF